MKTYEIDINGRYAGIISATSEEEAVAKAEEMYPNVKSSIQVWQIGGEY